MYTLPPKARFSSSVGNGLFNSASLDLPFAKTKSLVDATTGANLVDFTRASSGTYVDSEGVIRTATTNLLSYSGDITNNAWHVRDNVTVAALVDGAAPDGSTDGATLTSTGSETFGRTTTGTIGVHYTFSVWIRRRSGDGPIALVVGDNIAVTVTVPYDGKWHRVSATNAPTATLVRSYVRWGDSGESIDIWGAQLEQSTTVGEYVPTTSTINSAPRFDHNPTTGESLGLLVEEQRTNLFTHSESISSGWVISNTSITSDAIASPVGTITADLATNTGGNDSISRVATVGSSATVAFSLYMKRSNIDWVRLTFLNGANEVQAWFNLSTGTIGTVNATGIATSASASIQNIGNGWHRCVLVGAIPGQTSYTFFNTTAAADASFTRVTGGERYLWGAQLEEGSFPTSYIPTTDAAATRAADVASISGSNFSSWYRQDEGTVFWSGSMYDFYSVFWATIAKFL
jgi:hypothetical protein